MWFSELSGAISDANAENAQIRGDEAEQRAELAKANDDLAQKVKELENHLQEEEKEDISAQQELKHQADMYHARGILMAGFDEALECPYLENLDVDAFRNQRFTYKISDLVQKYCLQFLKLRGM